MDWYGRLYETDIFQNCLRDKLEHSQAELSELFAVQIPEYAEWISGSVANDDIRWRQAYDADFQGAGNYQTWENNVRYLQYFCLNRLSSLCERYHVAREFAAWAPENSMHTVDFAVDGKIVYTMSVKDGETIKTDEIDSLREYTKGEWRLSCREDKAFNQYLPILEDCTLVYR